ncbi:hypothetical protein BD560DRAFT_429575 [Blakeslea trispora]|nr:hypothetical protein BD560DRAFT_429575 [Blakeslea trispora]
MFLTNNIYTDNAPTNRGIPVVATSSSAPRRSVPEYRQPTVSSDQRNFKQMEVAIKKLEVAQQKSDKLIEQLVRENQELKAKFKSKPEDSDRFGFPGSDAELQGLEKTVVECEMERLGETGWNLNETLMLGSTNKEIVKLIVRDFLGHSDLLLLLKKYQWMNANIVKFVKSVLRNRFKNAKDRIKNAARPEHVQRANKIRKRINNRKSKILAKRLETFARHEVVFTNDLLRFDGARPAYGTKAECLSILVSDMMSDQEGEVDETNTTFRFGRVPTYRSIICDAFFDEIDDLRTAENKEKNPQYTPTNVGPRRYVERLGVNPKVFESMPSWCLESERM